jgi:hypothetical protein
MFCSRPEISSIAPELLGPLRKPSDHRAAVIVSKIRNPLGLKLLMALGQNRITKDQPIYCRMCSKIDYQDAAEDNLHLRTLELLIKRAIVFSKEQFRSSSYCCDAPEMKIAVDANTRPNNSGITLDQRR